MLWLYIPSVVPSKTVWKVVQNDAIIKQWLKSVTAILLTLANSLNENTIIYARLARLSIASSLEKHIVCPVMEGHHEVRKSLRLLLTFEGAFWKLFHTPAIFIEIPLKYHSKGNKL